MRFKLSTELIEIFKKYKDGIYLETGFNEGRSAFEALTFGFKKVISIEINQKLVESGKKKFRNFIENNRLEIVAGDSAKLLEEILAKNNDIKVIFLDAHGGIVPSENDHPLEQELNIVKKYFSRDKLIIIDDYPGIKNYLTPIRSATIPNWALKLKPETFIRKINEITDNYTELPYIYSYSKFYLNAHINSYLILGKISQYLIIKSKIKNFLFLIYFYPMQFLKEFLRNNLNKRLYDNIKNLFN